MGGCPWLPEAPGRVASEIARSELRVEDLRRATAMALRTVGQGDVIGSARAFADISADLKSAASRLSRDLRQQHTADLASQLASRPAVSSLRAPSRPISASQGFSAGAALSTAIVVARAAGLARWQPGLNASQLAARPRAGQRTRLAIAWAPAATVTFAQGVAARLRQAAPLRNNLTVFSGLLRGLSPAS